MFNGVLDLIIHACGIAFIMLIVVLVGVLIWLVYEEDREGR